MPEQPPINVLFIHHAIGMGGAPRSLSFLIANLGSTVQATVLMPQRSGNEPVKQMFQDAGATVIEERHIRPFNGVNGCRCDSFHDRRYAVMSALPTAWAVRKWVKKLQPDIVHLNTSVLPFAAMGARWANRRIPVIAHVREAILDNRWGRFLAWMNRRYVHHFIGIDRNGLQRVGAAAEQSTVIPNFVDPSIFDESQADRSRFRERFDCQPDTVLFVSVCRITESNGTLEFARWLAEHPESLPPQAHFVFCGFDSCQQSEYAAAAREVIESTRQAEAMEFTSEVVDLIAAADVILVPFTSPHSARVLIEGASMGKPALISDWPNLIEQIQPDQSGLVFRLQEDRSPDDQSLIDAVNRLCASQSLRQQMGESAKAFANQNYDAKTNSNKTVDLYRKLLAT